MTSDPNLNIENAAPFNPGDIVEHGAGVRIVVKKCTLQVQHARTLWIIDGEDGNRYFAKNCKLLERPIVTRPEWPKFFESVETRGPEYRRRFVLPDSFGVWCDGTGVVDQTYEQAIRAVAEGTLVEVDENGVEVVADADLEPGTINDQGAFVGISEITGEAVHATQLKTEIETLAKQRDEAREELKEATAEFVRALSAAYRDRDELQNQLGTANKRIAAAQLALDGNTANQ